MIPKKYDIAQLKKGLEIEKEHTSDPKIALKIAIDHLNEDPKYYEKLQKAGLEECEDIKKNTISFEALASNRPLKNTIEEGEGIKNPYVDELIAECNRLIEILKDDELFEKERKKHKK